MKSNFSNILLPFLFIALFSFSTQVFAQSEITFNLNLKPQLTDSTFVPGRDVVEIVGSIYPLRMSQGLKLKDTAPVDSIYSVTVDFPRRHTGDRLSYNYVLKTESETMREPMSRELQLRNGEFNLDVLNFGSFAW